MAGGVATTLAKEVLRSPQIAGPISTAIGATIGALGGDVTPQDVQNFFKQADALVNGPNMEGIGEYVEQQMKNGHASPMDQLGQNIGEQVSGSWSWMNEQIGNVLGIGAQDSPQSPTTIEDPVQTSSTPPRSDYVINAGGQVVPSYNATNVEPLATSHANIKKLFEKMKSGQASPEEERLWMDLTRQHNELIKNNPVSASGNGYSLWAPDPTSSETAIARYNAMKDQFTDLKNGQITPDVLETFGKERKPFADQFMTVHPQVSSELDAFFNKVKDQGYQLKPEDQQTLKDLREKVDYLHHLQFGFDQTTGMHAQLLEQYYGPGNGGAGKLSGVQTALHETWFGVQGRSKVLDELFPGSATTAELPPETINALVQKYSDSQGAYEKDAAELTELMEGSGDG